MEPHKKSKLLSSYREEMLFQGEQPMESGGDGPGHGVMPKHTNKCTNCCTYSSRISQTSSKQFVRPRGAGDYIIPNPGNRMVPDTSSASEESCQSGQSSRTVISRQSAQQLRDKITNQCKWHDLVNKSIKDVDKAQREETLTNEIEECLKQLRFEKRSSQSFKQLSKKIVQDALGKPCESKTPADRTSQKSSMGKTFESKAPLAKMPFNGEASWCGDPFAWASQSQPPLTNVCSGNQTCKHTGAGMNSPYQDSYCKCKLFRPLPRKESLRAHERSQAGKSGMAQDSSFTTGFCHESTCNGPQFKDSYCKKGKCKNSACKAGWGSDPLFKQPPGKTGLPGSAQRKDNSCPTGLCQSHGIDAYCHNSFCTDSYLTHCLPTELFGMGPRKEIGLFQNSHAHSASPHNPLFGDSNCNKNGSLFKTAQHVDSRCQTCPNKDPESKDTHCNGGLCHDTTYTNLFKNPCQCQEAPTKVSSGGDSISICSDIKDSSSVETVKCAYKKEAKERRQTEETEDGKDTKDTQTESIQVDIKDVVHTRVIHPMIRKMQEIILKNMKLEITLLDEFEQLPVQIHDIYESALFNDD